LTKDIKRAYKISYKVNFTPKFLQSGSVSLNCASSDDNFLTTKRSSDNCPTAQKLEKGKRESSFPFYPLPATTLLAK